MRLLLRCPDVTVTGTLELLARRRGDEVRVGRADFTCEPSSEVVEVELSDRAQDRLEQRGRLTVTARIAADGAETEAELRIEPA